MLPPVWLGPVFSTGNSLTVTGGSAQNLVGGISSGQLLGSSVFLVGGSGGGEVLNILLNLRENTLQLGGGLDVLGGVLSRSDIGLLDGEAATEGTGDGVVTAADSADVSGRGCRVISF